MPDSRSMIHRSHRWRNSMSESEFSIDQHFEGRSSALRPLFDQVMDIVQGFGPVAAEPKKTCIHIARRTALAGIHTRKDCLLLEFKSAGPIDNPAIAKSEQLSANRWHHT